MRLCHFLPLGLALVMTGCGLLPRPTMSSFVAPEFAQYRIRRVVVLPFTGNASAEERRRITELFGEQLQAQQRFEVQLLDPTVVRSLKLPPPRSDRLVSAAAIITLAKKFQAQGVIRGRISSFKIWPLTLGVKAELISAADGRILWAADGLFEDRQLYSKHHSSAEQSFASISPEHFIRHATRKITATTRP